MVGSNPPVLSNAEPPDRDVADAGRYRWWYLLGLVAAGLVAYATSLGGVLVLDDEMSILDNPSIRRMWPPWATLSPPINSPLGGRPLANLTFAISYAVGGESPLGYHVVNLMVHLAAGLLLFGVVRRVLVHTGVTVRRGKAPLGAEGIAALAAALWLVHPLTTGTVTYISQRTEALAALFYLLTLYAFINGVERASRRWLAAAVASCAAGMACKEILVTAPMVVALFDRVFFAKSWREVWSDRKRFYLGLAATWLWLAWLMVEVSHRSVGLGRGVTAWTYACTECLAVVTYARLVLWPHPLIFDYGPVFLNFRGAIPYAAVLLILMGASMWAALRRPKVGFSALLFFILLAPTSSVIPVVEQPIAENRAYLPAAALVVLAVLGIHWWLGRRTWWVLGAVVVAAMAATMVRNRSYRDDIVLWSDTVLRRPQNPRAHTNLAVAFTAANRTTEALEHCREAIRLKPDERYAWRILVAALLAENRTAEAEAELQTAIRLVPNDAPLQAAQGLVLMQQHRLSEAEAVFRAALGRSDDVKIRIGYAELLIEMGRSGEAVAQADAILALRPGYAEVKAVRAAALFSLGRVPEALAGYAEVLRDRPNFIGGRMALARSLDRLGRSAEAKQEFEEILRRAPGSALARVDYGRMLLRAGQVQDAYKLAREAVGIDPKLAAGHCNLSGALIDLGRMEEALAEAEEALRLDPTLGEAHYNVGTALLRLGRPAEAVAHFEVALRAAPSDAKTRNNLAGAFYYLGRYKEAAAEYDAVVRQDPANQAARQNYARALERDGRKIEAVAAYREMLERDPGLLDMRRRLGSLLLEIGRGEEAKIEFEAILRTKPDDAASLESLQRLKGR